MMLQHEMAGGWSLEKPHIQLLIEKFPAAEDYLKLLIEEDEIHTAKRKALGNSQQLAVMLAFTRQALEDVQWNYKADWSFALSELKGRTTHMSPSLIHTSGSRQYRINLQNPSGASIDERINVSYEGHLPVM